MPLRVSDSPRFQRSLSIPWRARGIKILRKPSMIQLTGMLRGGAKRRGGVYVAKQNGSKGRSLLWVSQGSSVFGAHLGNRKRSFPGMDGPWLTERPNGFFQPTREPRLDGSTLGS